jgi:hypothetical protein
MPSPPKYQDAETEKIHLNYCYGGLSTDLKLAIPNSFYSSQALDFRTFPSQTSVLPGMTAVGTNINDLIQAMEQDLNGIRYGIGNLGHLYRIDANNNFSELAVLSENGSAGLLYNNVTDQLYIPGQTSVSTYGQVTTGNPGQPNFRSNVFAQSDDDQQGTLNLYDPSSGTFSGVLRSTAAATYSVPLAISEATGQFCFFSPAIEPGYSIKVFIVAKGTGNWTLTLHDSNNTSLASVTVTNANLTNNAFNEFVFGKQVRVLVGAVNASGAANYHWHVTSTVADGTVSVVNVGDLSSANFLWSAYRLVQTNNGWHPTALFSVNTGGFGTGTALCIGNGSYLSTYNFGNDAGPTNEQWVRHQLLLKHGYEVCGLSTNNQYLVIAAERRSTNANRNFQEGALYFWDGYSTAPNFVIDIPMGAPYGLQTFNNVTYFICAGSLFAWSGGQTVLKVRKLAYQNTDYLNTVDSTIVAPNMMTTRYNLLMIAYPSSTTNVNLTYGIYTWGSVELVYPNSLGFSYALSNGFLNNTGILNLQIGCTYNFVDTCYTPWQYTDANGTHYGVDLLNNSSTPAPNFNMLSLIYDGGVSYKVKNALRMQVTFLPLPAGYTLQAQYVLERGTPVLSPTAKQGDTKLVFEVDNARFSELQWGYVGTSSGATLPAVITGLTMEIQPLEDESDLRAVISVTSTDYV